MKILIKEAGLWVIWFIVRPFLQYLPLTFNYTVADIISWPVYWVDVRRRKILAEEVTRLFGDRFNKKEVAKIVRRSFRIYLKRQVENLLLGSFTKEKLDRIVSIEGLDNLELSHKKGKGVVLLLAHFGSFLLPLPVLGYKGYKICQVAGKPLLEENSPIHKKIFEIRKKETDKLPIQFIQTNNYLGPIVRALRNNEIIVMAFDGRTGNKWIPTRFLNRTAQFSPGPFNLAIKTGTTILPTFVVRQENDKHKIIFEAPMEMEITADKQEALEINTKKYAGIFEKYLLKYPCHFAMTLYSVRNEAARGMNRPLFVD